MSENNYQWDTYCKKKDCVAYNPDVIGRLRICDTCRKNENVKQMLLLFKDRYVKNEGR